MREVESAAIQGYAKAMSIAVFPHRTVQTVLAGLLLLIGIGLLPATVRAVEPDEVLSDPALEARAENIGRHLRCLVCQSQSIEESDAGLAKDLRVLVRERIKAGDTDEQIFAYIKSRYGDFVLMKPPLETKTLLLWSAPVLLLGAGLVAYIVMIRRSSRLGTSGPAPDTLSVQEQAELDTILSQDDKASKDGQ